MDLISKTEFKAHALEVLRNIEESGEPIVITDRGKPTLEIRKLRQQDIPPMELLKNTVVSYESPLDPVDDDEWDNA